MPMPARAAVDRSTSARDFLPARRDLPALHRAAAGCRGCPLYRRATQTVFGEGPADAALMLVGEQPGDREDRAGRPFVGPAGLLLDRALELAGIARADVYVTNAVKHFKWSARGKRRIHEKPGRGEVDACHPWLESEIDVVGPRVIVCLGATAAQALLGPSFRVSRERGKVIEDAGERTLLATHHPSALLRLREERERARALTELAGDLEVARRLARR